MAHLPVWTQGSFDVKKVGDASVEAGSVQGSPEGSRFLRIAHNNRLGGMDDGWCGTHQSGGGSPVELNQAARSGPVRRPGGACHPFAHKRVKRAANVGGVDTHADEPRGEVSLKGFDEPERVWKAAKQTAHNRHYVRFDEVVISRNQVPLCTRFLSPTRHRCSSVLMQEMTTMWRQSWQQRTGPTAGGRYQ